MFWNIQGLSQDKLSDVILGNMLKEYDIILLSETWASDQDEFVLDGFDYHNYPRKIYTRIVKETLVDWVCLFAKQYKKVLMPGVILMISLHGIF